MTSKTLDTKKGQNAIIYLSILEGHYFIQALFRGVWVVLWATNDGAQAYKCFDMIKGVPLKIREWPSVKAALGRQAARAGK
jgi:hypothetical protein